MCSGRLGVAKLAESVLAAQTELFSQVRAHLLGSVTFDQGSEWAEWETLAATFGLDVWFCDPHSPWQRGAIENTNGHVRHWFPRGTELAGLDPAEFPIVDVVEPEDFVIAPRRSMSDADMIILEDEPAPVQAAEAVLVRKQEFRQLFSRLRTGK